jgi:predicted enzyme related to lactoylglutathione lyase
VKNRVHLDLATTDSEAESARLLELGAAKLRDITEDGRLRWTTFADPEGNEFDLIVR